MISTLVTTKRQSILIKERLSARLSVYVVNGNRCMLVRYLRTESSGNLDEAMRFDSNWSLYFSFFKLTVTLIKSHNKNHKMARPNSLQVIRNRSIEPQTENKTEYENVHFRVFQARICVKSWNPKELKIPNFIYVLLPF